MVEPDDAVLVVEDEDFLSAVAAVEANALSNKRRRTYTSDAAKEGVYTAALRGSNSLAWKQSATAASGAPSSRVSSSVSSSVISDGGDSSPPEKPCPCGLGTCLILISNTQKNPGRKFYKCPLREENGGCGFFQWCDTSSGISNDAFGAINSGLNSSFPDLKCPCGAGSCLILTAKTGNNAGQQFYRCPANQGGSCGFFKWCNDQTVPAGLPVGASRGYNTTTNASIKSYGAQSGSSCFKCGKEGHWAKDCQMPSPEPLADSGGRPASSGTCYKCGKPGHWARDCSSSQDTKVWQRR